MRTRILLPFLLLAGFTLVHVEAAAQDHQSDTEKLNIAIPPDGELSKNELKNIAKDIRRLGEHPMAADYDIAFATLLRWLINSPDITVSVCTNVVELDESTAQDAAGARLFTYFLLASAAWMIEHPDEADDAVKANVGGVEGALSAYSHVQKQVGDDVVVEAIEKLRRLQNDGTLKDHVEKALAECYERAAEEAAE